MEILFKNKLKRIRDDFSLEKNHNFKINKIIQGKDYNSKYKNENKKIGNSCENNIKKKLDFLHKIKVDILKKGIKEEDCKIITPSNPEKGEEKEESIEYINKGFLGKGGFGMCYIYESTKDFIQYAAKIVDKKKKLQKEKSQQSIVAEINIQKSLNHPKIVKIKSCSEDADNVYIIQELCRNKSLADLLDKRGYLSEFEVQSYMFQLIQGLKYLHDKNIIHRDLKPSNLFLDEQLELKIGDFGLIAKLEKSKDRRKTTCGTIYYMAPEVIKPGDKGYSFEVDIWSVGVIMYKLLTGKYPFNDDSNDNKIIEDKIVIGKFDFYGTPYISEVAKDLIRQILVLDAKKRPGLGQILYHDFFHMNTFPKYLDIKFYTKEPSFEEKKFYYKQIMDDEGKINKEVKYKSLYRLIVNDIPEIKYEDIRKYDLNYSVIKKIDYWISFFHESHSGFCYYEVNNGLIGILYKKNKEENGYNGLKLIFNSDNDTIYEIINDNDEDKIKTYKIENIPEEISEKFNEFMKYHNRIKTKLYSKENEENKNEDNEIQKNSINSITEESSIQNEDLSTTLNNKDNSILSINNTKEKEKELIYITHYIKEKYAKFLFLSDMTKQIIFKDKIEVLISDKKEVVGYVDKFKKRSFIDLINIMKNPNKDLKIRLKYIRQINYNDIKTKMKNKMSKQENKNKEEKDNNDESTEEIYNDNSFN